jgi:hypothetical protein
VRNSIAHAVSKVAIGTEVTPVIDKAAGADEGVGVGLATRGDELANWLSSPPQLVKKARNDASAINLICLII